MCKQMEDMRNVAVDQAMEKNAIKMLMDNALRKVLDLKFSALLMDFPCGFWICKKRYRGRVDGQQLEKPVMRRQQSGMESAEQKKDRRLQAADEAAFLNIGNAQPAGQDNAE